MGRILLRLNLKTGERKKEDFIEMTCEVEEKNEQNSVLTTVRMPVWLRMRLGSGKSGSGQTDLVIPLEVILEITVS